MPDPAFSTGYGQANDRSRLGPLGRGALHGHDRCRRRCPRAARHRREPDGAHGRLVRRLHGQLGGRPDRPLPGDRHARQPVGAARLPRHHRPRAELGAGVRRPVRGSRPATSVNSPSGHVAKIRTPMLVIHGELDHRVPISEALRLWTDLRRHGVEASSSSTSPTRITGSSSRRTPGSGTRPSSPSSTSTSSAAPGSGPPSSDERRPPPLLADGAGGALRLRRTPLRRGASPDPSSRPCPVDPRRTPAGRTCLARPGRPLTGRTQHSGPLRAAVCSAKPNRSVRARVDHGRRPAGTIHRPGPSGPILAIVGEARLPPQLGTTAGPWSGNRLVRVIERCGGAARHGSTTGRHHGRRRARLPRLQRRLPRRSGRRGRRLHGDRRSPGIAGRSYPPELAGPLYPDGIPIVPEAELEKLFARQRIDLVVFAYSDVAHETVMHAASPGAGRRGRLRAARAGPHDAPEHASRSSPSARSGPAPARARRRATSPRSSRRQGLRVGRRPPPDALRRPRRASASSASRRTRTSTATRPRSRSARSTSRTSTPAASCTPGVDYEAILREAEKEADVVLWDGGNNDFPFYRPDLFVVVADPLRPGHELHYHPGETNLRMADVVVINKVDSADAGGRSPRSATNIARVNPRAEVDPRPLGADARRRRDRRASAWPSSRTARRSPTAA